MQAELSYRDEGIVNNIKSTPSSLLADGPTDMLIVSVCAITGRPLELIHANDFRLI